MVDQTLLLLLGFFLTTVVGGALGYYFQNRTWSHQFYVSRGVAEWEAAVKLFQEVSQLCDRRLYRMRRVVWGLADSRATSEIDQRLGEYREVLFAYNDRLNYNLAMVESYFGEGLRNDLEAGVFSGFARLGAELDRVLLHSGEVDIRSVEQGLGELSDQLYAINVRMIRAIQDGRVGSPNESN